MDRLNIKRGNPGHGDTCACSLINPRLRGGILGG